MKTLSNHSIMLPRLSALLVLIGFCEHCTQIESFSPSLINSRAMRNSHDRGLFMSVEPSSDLTGKVVAHRSLFRFSPTESAIQTPYTIEERQYFSVTQDKSLEPISTKSLIFRGVGSNDNDVKSEWSWRMDSDMNQGSVVKKNMPRDFTRVGPALHTINGLQEDDDRAWDDKFAIALYCMQHPEIINGEGIEVGSGAGLGGILSAIGAGLASNGKTESGQANSAVPVPDGLSKIVITDPGENSLGRCIENLRAAAFPSSKANVGQLDWSRGMSKNLENKFDFLLSCDCSHHLPSVNPLANLVDFSLKQEEGTFLHIGQPCQNFNDLQRQLESEHGIKTKSNQIVLEKIDLVPLILEGLEDVNSQMAGEIEAGGYVEYQNVDSSKYSVLIAGFHNDIDEKAQLRYAQNREVEESLVDTKRAEEEARIKAELKAEMLESVASPVSTVSALNLGGASYLGQLGGGFSAGKSAPAPNNNNNNGGSRSYLDELSSGMTFIQSQSYISVPASKAEMIMATTPAAAAMSTSSSTQSTYVGQTAPLNRFGANRAEPIGQNLNPSSLTESELRAIEMSMESKVEALAEASVEADCEEMVERAVTSQSAKNVSTEGQGARAAVSSISSSTTTVTTTTTTSSTTRSRYFGDGASSNTVQKVSSSTFTTNTMGQSASSQGSLAEVELRALEKSMEAKVESLAERSVERECEKAAEVMVEGMHYY